MTEAPTGVTEGPVEAGLCAADGQGARRRLQTWTLLFATFILLYGLTASGRLGNRDGEVRFQVARSMLQGSLAVPAEAVFANPVNPTGVGAAGDTLSFATETATPGADGRLYAITGPTHSVFMVPLLALAGPLGRALPDVSLFFLERFAVSFVNPIVTAATVALLFAAVQALGLSERTAAATAVLFGVTTLAWPYTRSAFAEPLTGFGLLLCFAGLLAWRHRGGALLMAVAGLGLGLAITNRPAAAIAAPALVGYALWIAHRRGSLLLTWPFGLTVALPMAALLAYNAVRFGSPLDNGYRTASWSLSLFPVGMFGFLLSPGKGVFWYNPVLLAALAGLPALRRRFPAETVVLAVTVLCWLLFHAVYRFWEGGWSWGPRLLLPILPLAMLPLGLALERAIVRRALPALFAVGLLVQLPAVGADYTRYLWATYLAGPAASYESLVYRPPSSPLLGQWGSFLGVVWNAFADGGLLQLRSEVAGKLAALAADGGSEMVRSVAVLDLSVLVGINVPDLWPVHLYLFGAPAWIVGPAALTMAVGLVISAAALGRRLAGSTSSGQS